MGYVQFSKQVLGKRVASKAFYQEAMDYFEEEYPDDSVYFLAVSDDLNWVRKHLGGRKPWQWRGRWSWGGWQRPGSLGCMRPHYFEPGPVCDLGRLPCWWRCLLNLWGYGQGRAQLNIVKKLVKEKM